jgi:hypothetical protein
VSNRLGIAQMALLGEVFGRPTLGCDFLSAR